MLKKYSTSREPSSGRSVQCTAFLILSIPYNARIEFLSFIFATLGSITPHISLKLSTTLSYLISIATQGPVVKCSAICLNSGKTPL